MAEKDMNKSKELEALKKNFDVKSIFSASSGDFGIKGVLKEFMSAKDVKTKTRLAVTEVNLIARGNFISSYLRYYGFERHADFLDHYHDDILTHRISHESGSRKELIEGLAARGSYLPDGGMGTQPQNMRKQM